MKGLYKNENGQLMMAANAIHYPDGTVIQVKEHIEKPEATEIKDEWRVFYTREAALKYFGIDETINKM
jgi:hypothetical protein